MSKRYSSRQLILAKCGVVVLIALVAGLRLADTPARIPLTIVAVLAMVGAWFGAYEALSHGIALLLGRSSPGGQPSVPPVPPPYRGGLRRRDVAIALGAFLGGQALVWTIAGIIAATRVEAGGAQADLLRAMTGLVPVALPGSLLAGGLALLLILRRWRRRLGAPVLAGMLGLSLGEPRQVVNGVLGGVALALLILPLMTLVADRPEPPDLITQLLGSSRSTLRAWMFSAVLLAPPIEELMFRGALLGGLASIWNIRAAALVSGVTFWLMHGPEFVHWPPALAIGLLTILATWLRVRSRSLGPPIAAHFGYNLVLATVMSLALLAKPKGTRWAREDRPPTVETATEPAPIGLAAGGDFRIPLLTRRAG